MQITYMQVLQVIFVYFVLNSPRAVEEEQSKSLLFNQLFRQQPMEDLQEP